jgi:hypothetical protein
MPSFLERERNHSPLDKGSAKSSPEIQATLMTGPNVQFLMKKSAKHLEQGG